VAPTRIGRPRPDQLETSANRSTSAVYRAPAGTDVLTIARGGFDAARKQVRDTIILDTAGRLTVDAPLMKEIADLSAAVKASETLLVVDAMTGQEAVNVAEAFHAAVPVTGLVLTKIDGDARGRRGTIHQRGDRAAGEVHGNRREDRRSRAVLPGPTGGVGSSAWATL